MRIIIGTLIALLLINSCSTDLDLGTDYDETMIVFGLLDPNTDTQYIKINRGYFDQSQDANNLLNNIDSIFYDTSTLDVKVHVNDGSTTIETFTFSPFTLGELNLSEDYPDHYIYRSIFSVSEDYTYDLEIVNSSTGITTTASTEIVSSTINIRKPLESSILNFDFDDQTEKLSLEWLIPENGDMFDLDIRFVYGEFTQDNIQKFVVDFASRNDENYGNLDLAPSMKTFQVGENKYLDIEVFNNQTIPSSGTRMSYNFVNRVFYNAISDSLEPTNLYRLPLYAELRFTYSGEDLTEYIRVNSAQIGLAQNSTAEPHNNIKNGVGIFSSRTLAIVRKNFYNFYSEVRDISIDIWLEFDTINAQQNIIDTIVHRDTSWLLQDTIIADFSKADPTGDIGASFTFSPTLDFLQETDLTKDLNFIDPR